MNLVIKVSLVPSSLHLFPGIFLLLFFAGSHSLASAADNVLYPHTHDLPEKTGRGKKDHERSGWRSCAHLNNINNHFFYRRLYMWQIVSCDDDFVDGGNGKFFLWREKWLIKGESRKKFFCLGRGKEKLFSQLV